MASYERECPESVSGHDSGDRDGKCTWCGKTVNTALPRPRLTGWRTQLDTEYRRHHDPDFGIDPLDY